MSSLLIILLPVLLTIAIAGIVRAMLGPERGGRIAGIAIAIGFLASWGFLLSPRWAATDAFERIGHIAAGAALVGLALDFFRPRVFWTAASAGLVILISAWASFNDGLALETSLTPVAALSVLAISILAFLFIARINRIREEFAVCYIAMGMVALALAIQAALVGDRDIALTSILLLMAVAAFAVTHVVVPLDVGDTVILGVSMALLAIVWALLERNPTTQMGLLLVPLILFADGTAKRIPMPDARIRNVLYPLALAGVAALPLGLGALITFVTYGP